MSENLQKLIGVAVIAAIVVIGNFVRAADRGLVSATIAGLGGLRTAYHEGQESKKNREG